MKQWQRTTLKNIGNAVEFVQDVLHDMPEVVEARGFIAFRVWSYVGYITFAQPIGQEVVAYTPPVPLPWREWVSPFVKQEAEE